MDYIITISCEKLMDGWREYIRKRGFDQDVPKTWDDFIEKKIGKRPFKSDQALWNSKFKFNNLNEAVLFKLRFS